MKYLVATFNIETSADLMQACQDLLADGAAEAGFESFEETETGMEAYVQKDLFDKEVLDAYQDHPDHMAVKAQVKPLCSSRTVVDYEA